MQFSLHRQQKILRTCSRTVLHCAGIWGSRVHNTLGGTRDLLLRVRDCHFQHLLASSCLSVCPSLWNNSAPTGRIFMKSVI